MWVAADECACQGCVDDDDDNRRSHDNDDVPTGRVVVESTELDATTWGMRCSDTLQHGRGAAADVHAHRRAVLASAFVKMPLSLVTSYLMNGAFRILTVAMTMSVGGPAALGSWRRGAMATAAARGWRRRRVETGGRGGEVRKALISRCSNTV